MIPEVTVAPSPREDHGEDRIAEPERRGAGERERNEVGRPDADDSEILLRSGSDHRPGHRPLVHVVVEHDGDPCRALDDVVVREDDPAPV